MFSSLFSGFRTARPAQNKALRGRLDLENLEERNLMTASPYTQIGSNLYQVTNNVYKLVDTSVVSFQYASSNKCLVDLHSNGNLNDTFNGTSWTTLERLVTSYTLNSAGTSVSFTDWFSSHLSNAGVQSLARADFLRDGSLTRSDMLGLFTQAETGGSIASSALTDLRTIVANAATLNIAGSVDYLACQVVNSDAANAHYQGIAVGNLSAGAASWKMQDLVDKWFLGTDLPTEVGGQTQMAYSAVNLPLFSAGGPSYTDVYQGDLGDCTFLSSVAEVAYRDNSAIQGMFTANGDGTYTVRFFESGTPVYVTVNNELPGGGNLYDHPGSDAWVALAEKAYAQLNEEGWLQTVQPGVNSYTAINNGNSTTELTALMALSGRSGSSISINPTNIAAAYQSGALIVLGTDNSTTNSHVEHNHAYAMIAYNPSSSNPFSFFNPWGINGGTDTSGNFIWGSFSCNAPFVSSNFGSGASVGSSLDNVLDSAEAGRTLGIAPSVGLFGTGALLGQAQTAEQATAPAASTTSRLDAVFVSLGTQNLTSTAGSTGGQTTLTGDSHSASDQLFGEGGFGALFAD